MNSLGKMEDYDRLVDENTKLRVDIGRQKAAHKDSKDWFDALKAAYDALRKEHEELLKQEPVGRCLKPSQHSIDRSLIQPHKREPILGKLHDLTFWVEDYPLYAKPMLPTIPEGMALVPEIRQINMVKLFGDQSVIVYFTSCRAASAFKNAIGAARKGSKQ